MVITGLTRNQLGSNPPRVRISPSPPENNESHLWCGSFFCELEIQTGQMRSIRNSPVDCFDARVRAVERKSDRANLAV